MKRILVLLSITILFATNCLSQIPTQYLYAPVDNCVTPLPDYRSMVSVTENCLLDTIIQNPNPGTIINEINVINNVTITAIDISNNSSNISLDVILLDTIAPVITLDTTYSAESVRVMRNLLNAYHSTVMNTINYAYNTGPDSIYVDSLDIWFPNPWHREIDYDNFNLVTWTNNQENYFATFHGQNTYMCPCDSIPQELTMEY